MNFLRHKKAHVFFKILQFLSSKKQRQNFVQNNDHYLILRCFYFHFSNFVILRIWLFPPTLKTLAKVVKFTLGILFIYLFISKFSHFILFFKEETTKFVGKKNKITIEHMMST